MSARRRHLGLLVQVDDERQRVVHHPLRTLAHRAVLDRLDVTILFYLQGGIGGPEHVGPLGRHRQRWIPHDQIGFADLPRRGIREHPRRRHVGRVAARGAVVDPRGNLGNLGLAQRGIVLELLDPDVAIDVPGRHLARDDAIPDRARPRTDLFIGHQRHRRHFARPMAGLARALQDRRDVLREGDRRLAVRRLRRPRRGQRCQRRDQQQTDESGICARCRSDHVKLHDWFPVAGPQCSRALARNPYPVRVIEVTRWPAARLPCGCTSDRR